MKRWLRRLTGGVMALCLLLSLSAPALATGETTVFTGIDTLMIYNPLTNQRRTMSTGSMTGQVGRDRTNAALLDDAQLSGLEEPGEGFYFADQDSLLEELTAIQTTDLRDLEELFPDAEGPTQEIPEEGPAAPDSDPDLMQPQEGMAEDGLHFADQDAMQEELPRNEGLPDSGEEEDDASLFGLEDQVGDRKSFHYQPGNRYTGASADFTCLYVGTRCRIWGYGFSNRSITNAMGAAFDNTIFQNDTNAFGTARYIQDGDKLNILIYPMSSRGLCGFFRPIELLTASEMGSQQALYNHGEAVIHINTSVCTAQNYETYGLVTLAHEFQHLICFSSSLMGPGWGNDMPMVGTWLNEAMSMQAEEISYPGEVVRAEYISYSYNRSGDIASGQSLYNFATENDIGVYGQVFMFSEYLKTQSGATGVYKNIHNYWRSHRSAADLTDAKVLFSVLSNVRGQVEGVASYPTNLRLSAEESFLSKLNLAFQIGTVVKDSGGIYSLGSACNESNPRLFTGTWGSIEGGGRLLIATQDGNSYTVPSGADSRLIYVGFKNGRMVMKPTTAADYGRPSYTVSATVNDPSLGSASVAGNVITVTLASGNVGYGSPAYEVVSGSAAVVQDGNTFTVSSAGNCTIRINLQGNVSVTASRNRLNVGEGVQLSVGVPGGQTYTFASSDGSVATVSSGGYVTAVGSGIAVITVTTNTNLRATFTVYVIDAAFIAQGFDGGSGTAEDPYLVSTPSSLFHLANVTNAGHSFKGEYIEQTADINLNGTEENPWTPIGTTQSAPFSGTYYGSARTITGLYMDSGRIQGLFGVVDGGEVDNLSIDDSTFRGGSYAGAFVGHGLNACLADLNTLSGVSVISGSESPSYIGGIIGNQEAHTGDGQIGFCSNAGRIDSTATPDNLDVDTGTGTGGIAGRVYGGGSSQGIVACRNEGTIQGNVGDQCGGIVGILYTGAVIACCNTGSVTSRGFAGGIAGRGQTSPYGSDGFTISNCYNAGAISGTNYGQAAGIVAHGIGGRAQTCYSYGKITSENPNYTGGTVSWKEDGMGVSSCLYLTGSVQYPKDLEEEGALSVSSDVLHRSSSMEQWGFDMDGFWTFRDDVNSGYPVLSCFHPSWLNAPLVYDRACGAQQEDVTARFQVYLCIMEGLRNGERNDRNPEDGDAGVGSADVPEEFYEIESSDSNIGSATLTIKSAYLDTLSLGDHTLTARFGANVNVDFTVSVRDTPPDRLILQARSARVENGRLQAAFAVSAPQQISLEEDVPEALLVMASYDKNGKQAGLALSGVTLNQGRNDVTITIPYDASAGREYRVFLLDSDSRPLMDTMRFRTPQELEGSMVTGQGVDLTGLSVGPAAISGAPGSSLDLDLTVTAQFSDGTTRTLRTGEYTVTSDNSSVASINGSSIRFNQVGSANLTVSCTYAGVTMIAQVPVTCRYPALTGITVEPGSISGKTGHTRDLTVTVQYADGSSRELSSGYTVVSSDSSVASCAGGKVRLTGNGEATLTVSYTENGIEKTARVPVTCQGVALTGLSVEPGSIRAPALGTKLLKVTARYGDGSSRALNFSDFTVESTNPLGAVHN